jgi:hypothetical protein
MLVTPALNVTVPDAARKSDGDVADPSVVA